MKKRTVIWLLAAVILLLGIYLVVDNWKAISNRLFPEELGEYQGDGTSVIYSLGSSDAITQIDWILDGNEYSIYRDEDGEFVCDDDITLDQDTVKNELLSNLYSIKASHTLEQAALADYGLDAPWMQFTVYGGGEETEDSDKPKVDSGADTRERYTLYIGSYNSVTGTYYATMDFQTVYLLYNKLTTHFGNYEFYTVVETAPESSSASYIAVTKDGEKHEYFSSVDGDGTFYSTVFTWYTPLENGVPQPINVDTLDTIYSIFYELEYSSTVESRPKDLSKYGLDEPGITLEVIYQYEVTEKDPAGNETYATKEDSFILLVGDAADEENIYVMQQGSDVVHTMSTEKLEPLQNFRAESMPLYIAVVPEWQTLKSMQITLADGTSCFCEIRTDAEGTSTYYIEGAQVEKEDLRSIFSSLFNPAVDGVDPDANRSRDDAAITVRFLRNRSTFSDMTLYLIPYSSSLYVVDFAGEQKYLVSSRVIDGITQAVTDALALVQ